jgi:hypothetical protein
MVETLRKRSVVNRDADIPGRQPFVRSRVHQSFFGVSFRNFSVTAATAGPAERS